jgi:hypothetical protein
MARMIPASWPMNAFAPARSMPTNVSMFIPALNAAGPAPVKTRPVTPGPRFTTVSVSPGRSSACSTFSLSGRLKVTQR